MKKFLFVLLIAFTAFSSCKNKDAVRVLENDISKDVWMVETMHGDTVYEIDFMRGSPSIIFKDSTTFSGSTGCNEYSARFKTTPTGVEINMGPITKMYCKGKEEAVFVEALNATNRVKIEGDIMHFYKDDEDLLGFRKVR